ncbi:MAG: GtrA family protein [Oscillospiraceae bacterium]|nr:GtrA family protein [Oscillospiraceae bacterium]
MFKLIKDLFAIPLISYLFVGAAATAVEWVFFWLLDSALGVQYLLATAIAFCISTFANWLLGRLWTFKDAERGNIWAELGKIYAAAIVGLLLNLLIMWVLVDRLGLADMLSKIIATVLVFSYNFLIRKLVIYRR